ncbi:MAG TPA: LytR C-terminal domain-containing protein [Acidimicrobiales bacterium]
MGAGLAAAGVAIAVLVFNVSITKSSTATKRPSITTTSTTQPATTTTVNPGRPPAQVHLVVLNGSGAVGAAGSKAYMLGALGYQIVSLANTTGRQGTVVECKPGFELEAATLAKNVGAGATVTPFPAAPPTGSANADCVVVLGQ